MKIKDKTRVLRQGLGMANPKYTHQSLQEVITRKFSRLFPSLEDHIHICFSLRIKKDENGEEYE